MSDYAVVNPATGEKVKEYPEIADEELRAAIERADAAYRSWSRSSSVADRAALIRKVGDLHKERTDELAAIIVREMGKPMDQAVGEVDFAGDIYHFYADNGESLMADEPIELLGGDGTAVIRRSPYGVLLGIMPWNYPYYQVARFAGPNLAIGNTILLKHAPQCPESAAAMQQIFDDAGFPEGCYENIYATNDQIERVIADPRVHGVSVTGSERAGAAVAEIAGRNLKKVVLELGGSDPFILLGTDDVGTVARQAAEARLDNTGQSCNAAKRFIVKDDYYDDFLAALTEQMGAAKPGDPSAEGTAVGPLSSKSAADRLEDQVRRAIDNGAEVVIGGGRDGNFFEPTILTGIEPGEEASQEEFFGPVAQVYKVGSEEEAVSLANDTAFGLGSYLMTDDPAQAERVADAIEAGMVYVNLVGADSPELPFGGFKRSGFGRELGRFGADEFVNKKLIRVAAWADLPSPRSGSRSKSDGPTAVVVGAGAFGAGVADALARRGWRVTIVEQDEPAGPRSTSGDATRLLRFGHGLFDPDGWYTRSAWLARTMWKELGEDTGSDLLVESGVVWFVHGDGEDEAASEATLRRLEIPVSRIDPADLDRFFPSVRADDLTSALYEPAAGVLRVAKAVRALIARAQDRGAELISARALPAGDGSAVVDGRVLGADRTVWACGPWLPRLFPGEIDLSVTRQDIFYFDAPDLWTAPEVPAWIDSAGLEPYGHADVFGSGVKMLSDRVGPPFDVESRDTTADPRTFHLIRTALGSRFPGLEGAPLRSRAVCQYELSADRNFLIAPLGGNPSAWILGGGSGHGAKHAPALGEYLAALLAGDGEPDVRFRLR